MIEGVAMKKQKIKLNKKQQQTVDLIQSGVNVFLTGDAGTGKTTVIQQSVKGLEKDGKNVVITATTGIAADNIGMGAVTVHKAFGLGIEFEKYKDAPGFRSSYLQEADVVIIDEIGMCRFDLFSAIVKSIIAENNKRLEPGYSCNGKKKNAIQLIVVGDFFQLPPVIKKEDREILVEMYGTEYAQGETCERGYAFFSKAWKEMKFHCVKLEEVCRQKDAEFLGILNDIKYGRNLQNVIAYLESNQSSDLMKEAPYLVGTNAKADKINQAHMRALNEKTEKKFCAIIEGDVTYEDIKNISFAKQSLVVNIGAKVMLTANDANGEYVNGTMGTIINISKERGDATCIQVLTDKGKKVDVYRYEREIERQDIEEREEKDENGKTVIVKKIVRKIVGSFKQFPIKIAWAMSIHKSQGQTFGQVNIDPRCWDSGQFYVAVSRAESVAGIHFMDLIRKQYIRTLSDEVIKILKESLYSII